MQYMRAINNKQLGICLRLLFSEGLQGMVETVMNGKGRIEFRIRANVDENIFEELSRQYEILIS